MRDAAGGEELAVRIEASFGVPVQVVSGPVEARLTFRGALVGMPVGADAELAVFDIGGGSTEVVLGTLAGGEPALNYACSFDVGSVRLTERHVRSDPPSPAEC